MLDADELAEMRALQARAYGRDGGLSHAEAARLRGLQEGAVERGVSSVAPESGQTAVDARAAGSITESRVTGAVEPAEPASAATSPAVREPVDEAPASAPAPLRPPARWIALAAVAVLLCGVGIGWLLFGQSRAAAVALTAEQQEWQNALTAEGDYDPSSIRALAVEEGVVVWTATKEERRRTCLILGDGESTSPICQLTEMVAESGMYGSLIVDSVGVTQREVSAQLLFAASGEPAVAVSSYDYSSGSAGMIYANENETRIAEKLADEGFDPRSIWVAGYDGDVPIWSAMQLDSPGTCLIYDGSLSPSPMVCADPQTIVEQGAGLVLNVVDPQTGTTTTFEFSPHGPSALVITRERGEVGAGGD